MTIIAPKVELISETDPFKKIETAGRTCYKSEAKITGESSIKFYQKLVERNHTAMLEHATFVFEILRPNIYEQCQKCKHLNCTRIFLSDTQSRMLVSGNLRAINESAIMCLWIMLYKSYPSLVYQMQSSHYNTMWNTIKIIDEKALEKITGCQLVNLSSYNSLTEVEIDTHTYTTMRFTCDRGVTHELVRHRLFSFAQESTRYVNYSKEQNGNGDIKFIKPADFDLWSNDNRAVFENTCKMAENSYKTLISEGRTPQEARAILPNAIKTEIIVTGNGIEWKHFFDLRHFGKTGNPHPDMQIVADMAYEIYENIN